MCDNYKTTPNYTKEIKASYTQYGAATQNMVNNQNLLSLNSISFTILNRSKQSQNLSKTVRDSKYVMKFDYNLSTKLF